MKQTVEDSGSNTATACKVLWTSPRWWPDPEKVDERKVEFCPIIDLLPISGQVISLAFGRLKGVFFVGY